MTPIPENELKLQSYFSYSFLKLECGIRHTNLYSNISISNKKLDAERNPNPAIWCLDQLRNE